MHSVSFFGMTNDVWMARSLATAFELGQLAAMAGLMTLEKSNKKLILGLMVTLTAMQIMANMFYSYSHVTDANAWFELFGLNNTDPIVAKRILSAVSGGLLPIIALGFIKSLVDYLRPEESIEDEYSQIETYVAPLVTPSAEPIPDVNTYVPVVVPPKMHVVEDSLISLQPFEHIAQKIEEIIEDVIHDEPIVFSEISQAQVTQVHKVEVSPVIVSQVVVQPVPVTNTPEPTTLSYPEPLPPPVTHTVSHRAEAPTGSTKPRPAPRDGELPDVD